MSTVRALALMFLSSVIARPVVAQECGDNAPVTPVPAQVNGQRLWPPSGFQPAQPGQRLPDQRDSSDYRSLTIAGQQSGHELFQSIDIVGDSAYVAYNAGFQVWHIGGANAANPARRHVRDGWAGGFPSFPRPGEATVLTYEIGAGRGPDGSVTIAVSADSQVGLTLWRHTVDDQLMHVATLPAVATWQTRVATLAGRVYVFAGNLEQGVLLVDGADGALLGSVPAGPASARALDVLVRDGVAYVIYGGSPARPAQMYAITDPRRPEGRVELFELPSAAKAVTLFEHQGHVFYGGLRSGAVQVFQIDACLPPHGCADPGPPIWRQPLPDPPRAVEFLTFSRGPGSRPYLYYGFESARVAGTRKERLWDVTDIASTGRVTEITDGGGSYVDACGNTVDYWGHYYSGNASGFRNVAPRMGKWHDRYFYRVAIGLFDVHTLPP